MPNYNPYKLHLQHHMSWRRLHVGDASASSISTLTTTQTAPQQSSLTTKKQPHTTAAEDYYQSPFHPKAAPNFDVASSDEILSSPAMMKISVSGQPKKRG